MGEGKGYIKTMVGNGSVNISEDVVATIVATATAEVEGVYCLYFSPHKEAMQKLTRKGIARSVKLSIDGDDISVDVHILLAKGFAANEVGVDVQKAVISAIEDAVGVIVRAVNVHICGVALKRKPAPPAEQ
jgi:uncharacterized alkaline shock family protein YloU